MKILQLIDSLNIGGAERMSVNMANAFCDNSIDNVLVCARSNGELSHFLLNKTKFYELNKKSTFDFVALFRLFKLIKIENPTIIHAHSSSIYWGIIIKLFFPKIKLLWHDHFGLSDQLKDTDRKIIQILSRYIDGVVSVNEKLANWAKRNLETSNIDFIKNFPYLNSLDDNLKKDNVMLHLANLRPQKDHLTLIESIKILNTKTNIKFQVWCAGNDFFDEYSKLVKLKIKEYNLENKIKILGPIVDTIPILENASIALLCSESEGLPVSLLEYGLAALPVVVTDVGQCAEVVNFGEYGKVIPPKDPEKLSNAILELLLNVDVSKQMGIAFKQHIETEYGAQKFLKDYRELIGKL
jgi:glycosyltransferase involved in cell wall biosynthesis